MSKANKKRNYAAAIKFREDSIIRFRTNPPAGWSAEYIALNTKIAQEQIDLFKSLEA